MTRFASFLARSSPREGRPRIPPLFSAAACFLSNRSPKIGRVYQSIVLTHRTRELGKNAPNRLFVFLADRRSNRSGSIALTFFLSSGFNLLNASANRACALLSVLLFDIRGRSLSPLVCCFMNDAGSRGTPVERVVSLAAGGSALISRAVAAAAFARAAATPVLHRSRRTFRFETFSGAPKGSASSSSTHSASYQSQKQMR